jgi:hypothetical protein
MKFNVPSEVEDRRLEMSKEKTPDPKSPELDESGQAPPAGGSVGPPPSQSPFEPVPEPEAEKTHKNEKAHEKAPKDYDKDHKAK